MGDATKPFFKRVLASLNYGSIGRAWRKCCSQGEAISSAKDVGGWEGLSCQKMPNSGPSFYESASSSAFIYEGDFDTALAHLPYKADPELWPVSGIELVAPKSNLIFSRLRSSGGCGYGLLGVANLEKTNDNQAGSQDGEDHSGNEKPESIVRKITSKVAKPLGVVLAGIGLGMFGGYNFYYECTCSVPRSFWETFCWLVAADGCCESLGAGD